MKRILILCLLMIFSTLSFSSSGITRDNLTGFESLSEAQKAEVVKYISTRQKSTGIDEISKISPDKMEEWAAKGTAIGRAVGIAAKELGIAANEFIQTDAGKITVVIIAWKLLGHDILHIMGGFTFFLIFTSIWFYIFRKRYLLGKVTLTPVNVKILGMDFVRYKKEVDYSKLEFNGEAFIMAVAAFLYSIICLVIIFK